MEGDMSNPDSVEYAVLGARMARLERANRMLFIAGQWLIGSRGDVRLVIHGTDGKPVAELPGRALVPAQ
jgi:hypothetical protein